MSGLFDGLRSPLMAYADGGVIGRNPSLDGGTWAWCIVHRDDEVQCGSGIITPAEAGMEVITNNLTELLAIVRLMQHLDDGWDGVIHTDSWITVCRIRNKKPAFNGIPEWLQDELWRHRKRLAYSVEHLDGHPTKEQLESGIGKRGNKCSKWNVLCDELCNEEAMKFRRQ